MWFFSKMMLSVLIVANFLFVRPGLGVVEYRSESDNLPCVRQILSTMGILSMKISPSGDKLAVLFERFNTGIQELAILDMATGQIDKSFRASSLDPDFSSRTKSVLSVQWGQENYYVLYLAGDRILQMNIERGEITWMGDCRGCSSFVTHPTGSTAVIRKPSHDPLYRLEVSSPYRSSPRSVTVGGLPGGDASFSPDGRQIAYLVVSGQPSTITHYAIQSLDLYSKRIVTTNAESVFSPPWISDRAFIVSDPNSMALWKYDIVSNTQSLFVQLVTGNPDDEWVRGVAYMPSNRFLAFVTGRYSDDLYIADLACLQRTK